MSGGNSLRIELAEHIYQYLCSEAKNLELPEAARESLTAASECIEQAYNLNTNNTGNLSSKQQQQPDVRVNSPLPTTAASGAGQLSSATVSSSSSPATTVTNTTAAAAAASTSAQPKKRRHLIPGSRHRHHHHHHSTSIGVSVHQKNFKQKLIALIKKFRTDGSNFNSEEQYREALERELMKAAAGRGSRAIAELLEDDIEGEGQSAPSEPEEDWDNISAASAPKPSLRPFFSSTTLDKI